MASGRPSRLKEKRWKGGGEEEEGSVGPPASYQESASSFVLPANAPVTMALAVSPISKLTMIGIPIDRSDFPPWCS
jgi:hypothetical protein